MPTPDFQPLQELANQIVLFMPRLLGAFLLFIAFWIASRILQGVLLGVTGRTPRFDPVVRKLVADAVRITVLIVGMITALGTIDIDVSALVAGLGLASLALGLALRDIVSNAVSCVLILMYRPFRVGDSIKVSEHEGRVVNIDLRYTTLQFESRTILIPNQNVFSTVVVVNRPPEPKQLAQ
jgi:small conductance mechanosensitive channel